MGGESIIIVSYVNFKISINSSILLFMMSSEGLGGIGPEGIISKFSTSVFCTIASKFSAPIKNELIPLSLEIL